METRMYAQLLLLIGKRIVKLCPMLIIEYTLLMLWTTPSYEYIQYGANMLRTK